MLQATVLGQIKTTSNYCLSATVEGPYLFTYGGCMTDAKDFDIQTGADTVSEFKRKYQTGELCWYAYQYEDKSGSSADIVGPSQTCVTRYKDDAGFKKTVEGLHKAFLAYVDLVQADPGTEVRMPDIRKYLDFPSETPPRKWKTWALIGALSVLAVAGGAVIYTRRRPRSFTPARSL